MANVQNICCLLMHYLLNEVQKQIRIIFYFQLVINQSIHNYETLEQQGSICDFRNFRKLSLKNGVII